MKKGRRIELVISVHFLILCLEFKICSPYAIVLPTTFIRIITLTASETSFFYHVVSANLTEIVYSLSYFMRFIDENTRT